MGAIRAVIFDVDGTLVDSNDGHARAWVDAHVGKGVVYGGMLPALTRAFHFHLYPNPRNPAGRRFPPCRLAPRDIDFGVTP